MKNSKSKIPSDAEIDGIVEQHFNEPNNPSYKKQFEDLEKKLRDSSEDSIRDRLRLKLLNYLESKQRYNN